MHCPPRTRQTPLRATTGVTCGRRGRPRPRAVARDGKREVTAKVGPTVQGRTSRPLRGPLRNRSSPGPPTDSSLFGRLWSLQSDDNKPHPYLSVSPRASDPQCVPQCRAPRDQCLPPHPARHVLPLPPKEGPFGPPRPPGATGHSSRDGGGPPVVPHRCGKDRPGTSRCLPPRKTGPLPQRTEEEHPAGSPVTQSHHDRLRWRWS